jgi:uncharacterized SAM-binding protein YcdF (DUF218 family)
VKRAVAWMAAATKSRLRSVLVGALLVFQSGLFASFYGKGLAVYSGQWLKSALEARFERPTVDTWTAIRGLVVLGGQPARLKEALRLMRSHPHLRLVVSGPSDDEMDLILDSEDTIRSRTEIERNSLKTKRNTCGNAVFSTQMIAPRPGDRWLLVTSALHMPRAIGAFRKAGFSIEPWPVYNTTEDAAPPWRAVAHEWIGLIAYRLSGCSDEFIPGQYASGDGHR